MFVFSFVVNIHNVDQAFNFMKNDSGKCDYINTKDCIGLKNLYVTSFRHIQVLFIIVIILLSIFSNSLIINKIRYCYEGVVL